ncbi:MAG TPA: PQQ-dependent sugar dehydrogenase [Gaiellaceae bacterium]|nr:PQQ-dependent sugar dehydrogenase [Gaiellaceae bacterium]
MRGRLLVLLGLAGVLGAGLSSATAPAAPAGYRFVQIGSGFDQPVDVTTPRGVTDRLYVVEQPGRIRIVRNGRAVGTLLDIRSQVVCCGEQGLLSVAFHPRYAQNKRFFVYYTAPANRVVEYRGSRRVRTLLNVPDPYSNHNGGDLMFGPDGRLYVGMGDGGAGGDPENRAQNLGSKFGKLLAINVDKRGARWQVVGYGLRNPWRYSFDRKTRDLYIGDVGQNSFEEVDFTPRRSPGLENYGWDVYEGQSRYENKPRNPRGRLVFPITTYPLNGGDCAVTGGFVYRGTSVPAAVGRYFYGDNCSGKIRTLRVVGGRARSARTESFRLGGISSFGEDGNGELYAVTLDGRVWKLAAG